MVLEEDVWDTIDPDDIWVMDKLILSRKMGYVCGPIGTDVPKPDFYIVRPCVNALGLGLGASISFINECTDHFTPGSFWCEVFKGRHLSVDYLDGEQILAIEGIKPSDTFTKWTKWYKVEDQIPLPEILKPLSTKYRYLNAEYIDGKLIEVHFRHNPDWEEDLIEFIPVWEGQDTTPPVGYEYRDYPDIHGRIGAFLLKK